MAFEIQTTVTRPNFDTCPFAHTIIIICIMLFFFRESPLGKNRNRALAYAYVHTRFSRYFTRRGKKTALTRRRRDSRVRRAYLPTCRNAQTARVAQKSPRARAPEQKAKKPLRPVLPASSEGRGETDTSKTPGTRPGFASLRTIYTYTCADRIHCAVT